ncbi:hypothetical protein I7I52_07544 [Histoplasma capsulatum]|uniref:Uncharacterized protein n=1 Tax=Ajellomyces capsulatus TaxID=5037 RepID=A0A8H7YIR5_AJECA|nr:hypothetical protein I7I52_07544 [Histoplasma capsulatum]
MIIKHRNIKIKGGKWQRNRPKKITAHRRETKKKSLRENIKMSDLGVGSKIKKKKKKKRKVAELKMGEKEYKEIETGVSVMSYQGKQQVEAWPFVFSSRTLEL